MNKMVSLFLPIEVKSRCFESRLLISLYCANEGFRCYIGSKGAVNSTMFSQQTPYVYLSKGVVPESVPFLEKIHKTNGKIAYLDEEGGVDHKDWNIYLWRVDDRILKHVDLYFAWGETQKEIILTKRKNLSKEKILVTGNPRFNLLSNKYKKLLEFHNQQNNYIQDDFILINTSFGLGNTIRSFEEEFEHRLKILKSAIDPVKFQKKQYFHKLLSFYFLELAQEIAKEFPDIKVVLRPHPVENIKFYQHQLESFKNIIVTNGGNVHTWINKSKLVIHYDCTTAIEAYLAGKQYISYAPIKIDYLVQSLPMAISNTAKTKEEVFNLINQVYHGEHVVPNNVHEILKPIFSNVDFDAAPLIARSLKERLGEYNSYLPLKERYQEIKPKKTTVDYINHLKIKVKRMLRPPKQSELALKEMEYGNLKFPGIDLNEVNSRVNVFKEIEPGFEKITVQETQPNLFLLQKEE